jgi:hypothetical protein
MSILFALWGIVLMLFLTAYIKVGRANKGRVKKVEKDIKSVESKVNKIWQKIK